MILKKYDWSEIRKRILSVASHDVNIDIPTKKFKKLAIIKLCIGKFMSWRW